MSFGQEVFEFQIGFARVEDDIRGEVKHSFQITRRHIQKQTHSRGNSFKIPDMADGGGKFDMSHAFASDFGFGDFDTAAVTDGAFKTNTLIFTAVTFPIASGAEDAFAKEAVAFGLESAIVNGFGLLDFAVRPAANNIGRSKRDTHRVENINVEHEKTPLVMVVGKIIIRVKINIDGKRRGVGVGIKVDAQIKSFLF